MYTDAVAILKDAAVQTEYNGTAWTTLVHAAQPLDTTAGNTIVRASLTSKVTLQCNECGKKRKVSAHGNYNDRCPKCGGVDWDVL